MYEARRQAQAVVRPFPDRRLALQVSRTSAGARGLVKDEQDGLEKNAAVPAARDRLRRSHQCFVFDRAPPPIRGGRAGPLLGWLLPRRPDLHAALARRLSARG